MTRAEQLARAVLDGSARDEDVKELARLVVNADRPAGEPGNLYDGCLCGEISPQDKPCITCESRLSLWDDLATERDKLRVELAASKAYAKRCEDAYTHWLGRAAENDRRYVDVMVERDALRDRLAKLEAAARALHKCGYDPTEDDSAQAWRAVGELLKGSGNGQTEAK